MAATLKIPTIFTAKDKVSSIVKTMSKSVRRFSKNGIRDVRSFSSRGKRLIRSFVSTSVASIRRLDQKLSRSFKKMGRFATMGLGVGIGFIAFNAINTVKNYEQSLADLSAVMNTTTENQLILSKDAERLGAITAKSATEVVGLQEAFARLGFTTPQIVNMTEATISGSIAMNSELSETAELVGAMVKTFDNFSSIDTPDIIDKMTLATQKSALNFEKLQTALPIVSGASNAAGISFERTVALLGKLSDAGIDASSSSTALRNIFLESAKQGLSYDQILKKIVKESNKLTAANDEFGKRGAVSATILSGKLKEVDILTNKLTDSTVFRGAAQTAADKRLATFGGSLTLLSSAYQGLLISSDKSSGSLKIMTGIIQFATKHINKIALGIVILLGLFVAMKVVVGIIKGVEIAIKLWTGAQWLLNLALNANPIGLIIIGIAALVGLVALIINKYNDWGAALTVVLGPLGMIINLIQSFRRNWDLVKESFKTGGILEGLKTIGKVILDSVLMPMQQFFELLAKIPGAGKFIDPMINNIKEFRAGLGLNVDTEEKPEVQNNPQIQSNKTTLETIKKNNVQIDINDKGNNVGNVQSSGDLEIPINISTTQGAFG